MMYRQSILKKWFPWGGIFAKRDNFNWGYFTVEAQYVAKYLHQPSNILVIGSGNGREARPICRDGNRIVCMDIGLGYLISGQTLFAAEGIRNVHFIEGDVFQLPFTKNSFDFVFFSLYSKCKKHRFEVMRGILRILRPAGFLLHSCCTPLYLTKQKTGFNGAIVEDVGQLRLEVTSCGFKILESAVDPQRPEYRFSILQPRKFRKTMKLGK